MDKPAERLDEVTTFPCPICGAEPMQPCRDEDTGKVLHRAHHVGRFTGGTNLMVLRDEDGHFRVIDN